MRTKSISAKALTLFIAIIAAAFLMPGMVKAGNLQPTAPPGPTMKTLDEVPPTWSQKLPNAYFGRWVIALDGAGMLDRETGLVWETSPLSTTRDWYAAIEYCYNADVGGRKGWRLPTIEELASLVDTTRSNPALPSGHPFLNVQSSWYWSATTNSSLSGSAWNVSLYDGYVGVNYKTGYGCAWCVRGGHGHDGR